MRSKKWKNKGISTETLTDIEVSEIMAGSGDYDNGKAPVSRNTQYAEDLADLSELQREHHSREEMSKTHSYDAFEAVRNFGPGTSAGAGLRNSAGAGPALSAADSEDSFIEADPVERSAGGPAIQLYGSDYSSVQEAPKAPETQPSFEDGLISKSDLDTLLNPDDSEQMPSSTVDEDFAVDVYQGESADFYSELGDTEYYNELHDATQFTLEPLSPDDAKYEDIMDNYEEVMEKMASNPTKPKFWFKEKGDHWYCTCGHLNKGPTCSNCGLERDLLRALFFLHEPTGEPGNYEGMNVHFTDVEIKGGKFSSKTKLIIAIAAVVVLLVGTGIFSYYYVIKPSMEKEAAKGEAAAAKSLEANVPACVGDLEEFLWGSYVSAGDECLKNKKYETAIDFYGKAQEIKDNSDIQDSINKAKYGYVCDNKSKGGDKFEKYLLELHKIGYSDINKIYNEYYAWHIKIIANKSKDDTNTDIDSASRADTIFFHVFASGGPPGETMDVYYEATWPSGSKQTEMLGTGWKAGSSQAVPFMYPVPILGQEGPLTFKVFDKSTSKELASDTVTLSK
mgnify:CR=1 FL=1